MSERNHVIKTLNLSSIVSKKTRRAKARLLQNFGKADKTHDELLEVYQENLTRQQNTAVALQKHVKHYLNCLKELHEASKGLSQSLLDIHERDWPKHDVFENNAYELDHVNEDLEEKLKESVLVPLEQYLGQFAEMREKLAKRGRKLVDYDSQRHTFEALQQNQNGKQDESKLNRCREQLEEAKKVYDTLNSELHDELPALYDNRLPFIITVFQRLFSSVITYHTDLTTINKGYIETVELLAKATEKGTLDSIQPLSYPQVPKSSIIDQASKADLKTKSSDIKSKLSSNLADALHGNKDIFYPCSDEPNKKDKNGRLTEPPVPPPQPPPLQSANAKPPSPLYKVQATYKYMNEDEDELSFDAGEIIQVIEYDDPTEQEEGWLMGIKESTGEKGLFPANFTKRLS